MNSIFCDYNKLFNSDKKLYLGNKLLHIFFLVGLAHENKLKLKLPLNASISQVFQTNSDLFSEEIKRNNNIDLIFEENSIFEIYNKNSLIKKKFINFILTLENYTKIKKRLIKRSEEQFLLSKKFKEKFKFSKGCFITGNFWHYNLMPKQSVIEESFFFNKDLINKIKKKIPEIDSKETIAVHFRGKDFSNHLRKYFRKGIKLNKKYYCDALNILFDKYGKNFKFILFSDEMDTLLEYLKDFKIDTRIINNQSPIEDWLSLMLSKNIIQSNSSFCWTASLFNKDISIQPRFGYGYNDNFGPIPYGFYMNNSIIV